MTAQDDDQLDEPRKLKWFPMEPKDFFDGCAELDYDASIMGPYALLLFLIYASVEAKLKDDPRIIARRIGMTTTALNRVRSRLVADGKIKVVEGHLINPRASRYFEKTMPNIEENREKSRGKRQNKTEKKTEKKTSEKNPTQSYQRLALDDPPQTTPYTRARESIVDSNRVDDATIIAAVGEIALILKQSRGRYWEDQFRKMIDNDDVDPVDLIEAARAHKGGHVTSLNALRGLARHKRNERTHHDPGEAAPAPATEISVEDWTISAIQLLEKGLWNDNRFGPMPGTMGYRGPQEIEARFLNVWIKQGSHPLNEMDVDDYMRKYPADFPDPGRRARWSTIAT